MDGSDFGLDNHSVVNRFHCDRVDDAKGCEAGGNGPGALRK